MGAPKGNRYAVGNGRPRIKNDVRALARVYTAEAVKVLAGIMRESEKDGDRVAACKELLDRGYGKPTQPIEGSVDVNHLVDRARELPQSALDRLFAETAVEH